MKRKLLFLLPLLMLVFSIDANAQQQFNGDYFVAATPNASWNILPLDVEFEGEAAHFIKAKGESLLSYPLIMAVSEIKDMKGVEAHLKDQTSIHNFVPGSVSKIYKDEFMGQPTSVFDFKIDLEGAVFEGSMYAMIVDGVMYSFMSYQAAGEPTTDLIALLNSFAVVE